MRLQTEDKSKTFYLQFSNEEIKNIKEKSYLEFDFKNVRQLSEMFLTIAMELGKRVVDIEKEMEKNKNE